MVRFIKKKTMSLNVNLLIVAMRSQGDQMFSINMLMSKISISGYDMDFSMMVMLRSTTGPYGRFVIEVAYEEMIFSLHRGYMGDDSSRRMDGVSA